MAELVDDVQDDMHGCISLAGDRMSVAMHECHEGQDVRDEYMEVFG